MIVLAFFFHVVAINLKSFHVIAANLTTYFVIETNFFKYLRKYFFYFDNIQLTLPPKKQTL